jgi:osmotically-inducible protein OsmY
MKNLLSLVCLTLCGALNALLIPDARADDSTNSTPYHHYGATGTNDVDNSGINERDRHDQTRTPFEQGNSTNDIRITREIRQYVVSRTNNFSVMAHNVKIITRNGQVTLRGPVQTQEEKSSIVQMARETAGENNVTDMLEVKNNP